MIRLAIYAILALFTASGGSYATYKVMNYRIQVKNGEILHLKNVIADIKRKAADEQDEINERLRQAREASERIDNAHKYIKRLPDKPDKYSKSKNCRDC